MRSCLLVLVLAARAAAQEPPPVPAPLPPMPEEPAPVPRLAPPAPPEAPWIVPGPTPEELDAMAESARREKLAGVGLMAGGGGLIAIGTALTIAGLWSDDAGCQYRTYSFTYGHPAHPACGNAALTWAGGSVALIGTAALVAGFPVYLHGSSRLAAVRDLRRRLVVLPAITSRSGGVAMAAAF